MPLSLTHGATTLVVRKDAFERAGFTRRQIDEALTLTDEEFRVERNLVGIGPIYEVDGLATLIESLEQRGLVYFDDFFEMSGNWPEWLSLFVLAGRD
ncbi:MAG TPA: hypothetical protein VHE78_11805 [Gemmatimonadaceae bacterium]|nr:hypothetical protein [Gemmatimonadaceae bacterium]